MTDGSLWVRIECHFGSMFSYRIPNFNSFYALASPVPSPSAVKLGLVSSAIEATGDVAVGRSLFDAVRSADIAIAPAVRVAASRVLTKRLKKPKSKTAGFTESFGIREYMHLGGPLTVWINTKADAIDSCLLAARHLRRLGTTDSLCTAMPSTGGEPDWTVCARPPGDFIADPEAFRERIVVPLNDLTEKAQLEHFAPNNGSPRGASRALSNQPYILPLKVAKQGANWLLYERVPFQ